MRNKLKLLQPIYKLNKCTKVIDYALATYLDMHNIIVFYI